MSIENKLSLVAKYDDVCRLIYRLADAHNNKEFIKFVQNQDECREKWLSQKLEAQHWHNKYLAVQGEVKALEGKLSYARTTIETEIKRRMKAEEERDSLARQVSLIRELLLDTNALNDQTREKLAFLNSTCQMPQKNQNSPKRLDTIDESLGSVLSSLDVTYDKTDDEIDQAFVKTCKKSGGKSLEKLSDSSGGKRRPSAPPASDITPPKRIKSDQEIGFVINSSLTATLEVPIPESKFVKTKSSVIDTGKHYGGGKHNRSYSETVITNSKHPMETRRRAAKVTDDTNIITIQAEIKTPILNPIVHRFSSASRLNSRPHTFCNKTIIKPEMCTPCGRRIKFGKVALKCKDCKATCHPECKDEVPLPCVSAGLNTPSGKGVMGTIADYIPGKPPLVPALVIHCINEIESRGLNEIGIYRVPGSEKEVKDLKERFLRGKGFPNLSKLDIHVVCGCLKDFLRSLKEPLVTYTKWREFVEAAEMSDSQDSFNSIYQTITELPRPNRDTLAYLILHLQRVSESIDCKMNASNLARVFGPTVVGYSCPEPEPAIMITETRKQAAVIEKLITISSEYWQTFVQEEEDFEGTPVSIYSTAPLKHAEGHRKRSGTLKPPSVGTRRNYFASPLLK